MEALLYWEKTNDCKFIRKAKKLYFFSFLFSFYWYRIPAYGIFVLLSFNFCSRVPLALRGSRRRGKELSWDSLVEESPTDDGRTCWGLAGRDGMDKDVR